MAMAPGAFERSIWIWAFCFIIVISLSVLYLRMPVLPLAAAGAVTLGITLFRASRARRAGKR